MPCHSLDEGMDGIKSIRERMTIGLACQLRSVGMKHGILSVAWIPYSSTDGLTLPSTGGSK